MKSFTSDIEKTHPTKTPQELKKEIPQEQKSFFTSFYTI